MDHRDEWVVAAKRTITASPGSEIMVPQLVANHCSERPTPVSKEKGHTCTTSSKI